MTSTLAFILMLLLAAAMQCTHFGDGDYRLALADDAVAEDEIADDISLAQSPQKETRPEWVEVEPKLDGGRYTFTVSSDPYTTTRECQQALASDLVEVVGSYADDLLNHPGAAADIGLSAERIRKRLVKQSWTETIETSVGPMQRVHVQLEIDQRARAELRSRWQEALRRRRLATVSIGAGVTLAGVALAFTLLQLGPRVRLPRRLPPRHSLRQRRAMAAAIDQASPSRTAFAYKPHAGQRSKKHRPCGPCRWPWGRR